MRGKSITLKFRRTAAAAVAVVIAFSFGVSAEAGFENFIPSYEYSGFSDVPSGEWYYEYVREVTELGIIEGRTPDKFAPDANLRLSEAVKLAACLHSLYATGELPDPSVSTGTGAENDSESDYGEVLWYSPYVVYAIGNGILDEPYDDFEAYATRLEFAHIFANALPPEALAQTSDVPDGTIPDVPADSEYAADIYALYRAGILDGVDDYGHYVPGRTIVRREVAAVVARMANPALRIEVALTPVPTDEELVAAETAKLAAILTALRADSGLTPYEIVPVLNEIAQFKASDMAETNELSKYSPNFGATKNLLPEFGIDGELNQQIGFKNSAREMADAWLANDSNKALMLFPDGYYGSVGFGAARGADGVIFFTVVYFRGEITAPEE
ncbi:MAG: S-layer homology domain-containing protein [Oscillospiraceae bacterium]|jgi:uncharacterized protein YkwD|nr:S-layer homology domain-containing protein [Oscillospiraceae bacterium]